MKPEIEIERRFLLSYIPIDLVNFPYKEIEDIMIKTGEPHPHLRLRRSGNKYVLTKKYPKEVDSKLQMMEETILLSEIEFNTLKKLESTHQSKRRYNYNYKNIDAEVDIWQGELSGLAIIEFEVPSKETALSLEVPDFCLKEITEEEWLAGGMLSGKRYLDLADRLTALGYTPIYF